MIDEGKLMNRLHEKLGLCGHCGKDKCAGRKEHSILPDKIPCNELVSAIAFVDENPSDLNVFTTVTVDVYSGKYVVELYNDDFSACLTPDLAEELGVILIRQAEAARIKQG